jgi:oxygen-independent coproporphyrinogen-3 oxidase
MIYIHVPFCRSYCTYCDFYSEIPCSNREGADFQCYTCSLLSEIEARRSEISATLGMNTLYIGGGTPSALPLENLKQIADALKCFGPYREFTIEVNPEDIVDKGDAYVEALRAIGVTRFSMGVQSLDDKMLSWMNRRHNAAGARKAFGLLKGERSVDIITGVPDMSIEILEKTVDEVIGWRPEHISAYQLSIEEGSALEKMIEDGKTDEAPEEECRKHYEFLCTSLKTAGYHHYEISNWSLPGHEALHNSAYWKRVPYVGLGPGAHSLRIGEDGTQIRSWNSKQISGWSVKGSEILSEQEIREETIMLGLRTDGGISGSLLGDCDCSLLEALLNGNYRIPENRLFVADDIISSLI